MKRNILPVPATTELKIAKAIGRSNN